MDIHTRYVTKDTMTPYQFVTESEGTRSGFRHTCTLFRDEREMVSTSIHYLNRTWESYRYQSVMRKAVDILIEQELTRFRENNNYPKRMSKAQKAEMEDAFFATPYGEELKELGAQL